MLPGRVGKRCSDELPPTQLAAQQLSAECAAAGLVHDAHSSKRSQEQHALTSAELGGSGTAAA